MKKLICAGLLIMSQSVLAAPATQYELEHRKQYCGGSIGIVMMAGKYHQAGYSWAETNREMREAAKGKGIPRSAINEMMGYAKYPFKFDYEIPAALAMDAYTDCVHEVIR